MLGLHRAAEVEGWIPIFLFAALFGLSMDYEVFMVTRIRESWEGTHDNARAVAHGLERTGRVVTAAAAIMVAAFSGFALGRVTGLQEFGIGLALAVLDRRDDRAGGARPVADGRARPLQLVAAAAFARLVGVPPSPLPDEGVRRGARGAPPQSPIAYLTTVIARRNAGSR